MIAAYTVIEIALRMILGVGSNVLVEFVGYGLAAMTFLGAAATMREGGLIRVNVVMNFLPPRAQQALDALCLLCGTVVIALIVRFVWADMQRSFTRGYETDSLVPLPLWLPPLGLFIGMSVFLLDMIAHFAVVIAHDGKLFDRFSDAS